VSRPKYSQYKSLGYGLIFVGLVFTPVMLFILTFSHPTVHGNDYLMAVLGLIVMSNGAMIAGVGILALENRFARWHQD